MSGPATTAPSLSAPAGAMLPAGGPALRWITFLIVVLAAVGVLVPAGPGWDFANFYDTGRRAAAGQLADIYHPDRLIDGAQPQGSMAYWSPPLSAYFYVPLALLSPLVALALFKLCGTVAWMVALWLLVLEHRPHAGPDSAARDRFTLGVAAGVLVFQPIWAIYRVGGQTTPFVLLLFTLALRAHVRGRVWAMAATTVVACLVKPAFALVPAWLLVPSTWRVPVALAVVGGATALGAVTWIGIPLHLEFLDVVRRGAQGGFGWPFNSSLYVVGESLKAAGPAWVAPVNAGVLLAKLVVAGLVGYTAWQARTLDAPAAARRHCHMLLAITGALLLSQVVWEHYLALLLPLWTYLLAVRGQLSPQARLLLCAGLCACVVQNIVVINVIRTFVPADGVALPTLLACVKSLPLLLTAIFLAHHRQQWFATYRAPSWQARA